MTVIGYARVSTEEQQYGIDGQRFALNAAGCKLIFEDLGVSAIAKKRLGFAKALASLKANDTLVVVKLDRAFRSLKQALETLEQFQHSGILFRSLTEHIDTSTPMGQAMYQIQNVFAELERKLISERTKAGLETARRRGVVLGRRRKLSEKNIAWARATLNAEKPHTMTQLAATLRVSPRTLTRALGRASREIAGY